jgi:glycosyltransferase involved in cell wall biosynthesis
MPAHHPFILLLQAAENFAYRNADKVISILPLAESHMRRHGLKEGKFCYIPNGIDLEEWRQPVQSLVEPYLSGIARLRNRGHFIVGYAGSHGLANELDSLLDAAKLLQDEPVAFYFVGHGPEKDRLIQRAEELELQNVIFMPPVPKTQVPSLLQASDALYIGLHRQPLFRFGVCPNKLLDYMMSARPVIHAIEAGNDLVAEAGCGFSTPPQDAPAVAAAIRRLMAMTPQQRAELGRRGREYVASRHDYRRLARDFLEAVDAQPHPAG